MRLNMRSNNSLLNAFDYARELDETVNTSRATTLANALKYVKNNPDIDFTEIQQFDGIKNYDRTSNIEFINFEVNEELFNDVKNIVQQCYPQTTIKYPFMCRIVLTAYIISLINSLQCNLNTMSIQNNRNQNIKWASHHNITCDKRILTNTDLRGIYAFFVGDNCLYVGRASSIYSRLFSDNCHIRNIRNNYHINSVLKAIENNEKIDIKMLEEVPYVNDHIAKDAQRLASRECYWIDYYQSMDMCLEQFPEGRWV